MKTENYNVEEIIKSFLENDYSKIKDLFKTYEYNTYFYDKIKNNLSSLIRINAYKYIYKNTFAEGIEGLDEYDIEHYLEYYSDAINKAMLTQITELKSEVNFFWKIFIKRLQKQIEKSIKKYYERKLDYIRFERLSPGDVIFTVSEDIKGDVYLFYKGHIYEFVLNIEQYEK